MKTKTQSREIKTHVSEAKKSALAKLISDINKSQTVMIALVEGISAAQLQKTKHTLKGKASLTIAKKSLVLRCLEQLKKEKPAMEKLEKWIERPFAIIFSDLDSFELASLLVEKRVPAKAKANQISPADIAIEVGATDLMAGPAISEFTAIGLKTGIEAGKIAVKERKVVAKKGEIISPAVAAVLSKLEIVPFMAGLEPLASFDAKENKVYENIKIDKEGTLNSMKTCTAEAFALAIHIDYTTSETISILLIKASQEINALSSLIK